jgi:hypothetical protein
MGMIGIIGIELGIGQTAHGLFSDAVDIAEPLAR